nr:hypothetical protein [Candidatus Sigynarchaeota archaeon]
MLILTILDQFYVESLLVSYFIILILGFELSVFFIFQKMMRKDRSPAWILAFSLTMLSFSVVYLFRAILDLGYGGNVTIADLISQLDMIVVSVASIGTGLLLFGFFRGNGRRSSTMGLVFMILGMISTVVNVIGTLMGWSIQIGLLFAGIPLLVLFMFPMYLLVQLAKHDDSGRKNLFYFILIGVFLNVLGMLFNFRLVEVSISAVLGTEVYSSVKLAVLVIIVIGLTMEALGFFYLPPVDDFFWKNHLVALYVLDKTSRFSLFKKVFDIKAIEALPFGRKDEQEGGASETVFISGIGGITDMLSETMETSGEKVEFIDQGVVKLLLAYEGDLIFILLAKQNVPILSWKLKSFKDTFMLFYGDMVKRFAKNPEKFLPVDKIASRIFVDVTQIKKEAKKA